jgi:very-short-patch-repair endonuclease/predicted transcriptional regulator of viral defense system
MHVVEREIARIAGRQDNVITRDQLLEAGLGRGALAHRVRAGRMRRLHRNVYTLAPAPPTPSARARAAVLACGAGAVLSYRSAAELHGLLPATDREIHVTVIGRNPGRHPGIKIHRHAMLAPDEAAMIRGIPVTSVARIICDLAATESPHDVESAFQEALYRRRDVDREVALLLAREPSRRGAPILRALLHDPQLTRSERERLLLRLIADAQLPRPATNVRRFGYLLDVYWEAEGLIVEFDGWGAHGHRHAFKTDRKRDQVLLAHGLRVLRVTDRQLMNEPMAVPVRIGQALQHRVDRAVQTYGAAVQTYGDAVQTYGA